MISNQKKMKKNEIGLNPRIQVSTLNRTFIIMLKQFRLRCFLFLAFSAILVVSGCTRQARSARHLKQADRYFDAKDFKKAEIEYLNVFRLAPTNAWVVERLATLYYDQGKFEGALFFLSRARALDKDNADVRTRLAHILLSASQLPEVRKEALYVLDRSPTNDDAILLLSDSAVTPKDIADTQQRLQKLPSQAATRAAWHLALSSLYLRQTNAVAAEGALKKALALEPQSSRVHLGWAAFYWVQNDLKNADLSFQKAAEFAPPNSPAPLRWVDFKFSTGAPKEGLELLKQITQKNPGSIPALAYLARVDFDLKDYQECSKLVQKILVQEQGNVQARLLHARLQRAQGKAPAAIQEMEELKRNYKASPEIDFELALAYYENQERAKAASSLQETLRLLPNHLQAALFLAQLNIEKGDPASAISALQNLLQQPRGFTQLDLTRAQFLLASAYSAQRRFDDALTLYSAMEKRLSNNPAIPFLSGLNFRQQNRNAEARRAFQRASLLTTNDLRTASELIDLDLLEKNYPAAFQRVQEFLLRHPRSPPAKLIEARIFLAQTNLNEAEAALQKAIEWEPNFGAAYELLAQTYLAGNKLPEALQQLAQVTEKNPRNVSALMKMATLLDKQGESAKAAKTYQDLLKVAPQFVPALNNLAYLLSEKLGKNDDAYPLASKARELSSADPKTAASISDTLGWIQFHRREFPRALLLLQESAAQLPQEPDIQFHLGMAFYMMGQEQNARLAFQHALQQNLDFQGRSEAQKRLALLDLDPNATDEKILAVLQNQLRQQPDDLPALLRLGRLYERTGLPDKARQTYEDARKANPNSATVLLQLARLNSTALKNPSQALILAREARKLAPDDPEIAHLLGRVADQSGDHQWASSLLQESAQKQPDNPEIPFDLAHALYSLGRVNEAEEVMRRALQTRAPFPQAQEAQSFLALITLLKSPEKCLESEAQVQQLLKARPDYLPVLMIAGLIDEQRGRVTEAKQTYEKIINQSPQFALARKQLAALYTDRLNDQQKAFEQASKARELLADDPDLAKTLGKIAYRRNDSRAAVRFLQESSLKRPDDSEVFYFLGLAHNQLKENDPTKQALNRSLTLNPNAPFAPEVRKILQGLTK